MVDDAFEGLPVWARVAALLGFPAVLAIVLTWFLMGSVTTDSQRNYNQLVANNAILVAIVTTMQANQRVDTEGRATITRLLSALCENAATTSAERVLCASSSNNQQYRYDPDAR